MKSGLSWARCYTKISIKKTEEILEHGKGYVKRIVSSTIYTEGEWYVKRMVMAYK